MSQLFCEMEFESSGTDPHFESLRSVADQYAPASIARAPNTLGELQRTIWTAAVNSSLGDSDSWSSVSIDYRGMVPLALVLRNPRKAISLRWAKVHTVVGSALDTVESMRQKLLGGEDAEQYPTRTSTLGIATMVSHTPHPAYGAEVFWSLLARMMETPGSSPISYTRFGAALRSRLPSPSVQLNFFLAVRAIVSRAIARLVGMTVVSSTDKYIKIKLSALTSRDIKSWIGGSTDEECLRNFALLLPMCISNLDIFLGVSAIASLWSSITQGKVLNYVTYSNHPLYLARKVQKAEGVIELCFDTAEDSPVVSVSGAFTQVQNGGELDDGSYKPALTVDHEGDSDPSPTDEEMFTDEEKKDEGFGPTPTAQDIVEAAPTADDDLTDVLVEGDVIGTLAAVSYADDTNIERRKQFAETEVASFSAGQLTDLVTFYAEVSATHGYPARFEEELEAKIRGNGIANYVDNFITSGGNAALYTPPIVPNLTKITTELNKALKQAQTKCDPSQLRAIGAKTVDGWYDEIADELGTELATVSKTPLGYFVLDQLPADWNPYVTAGPHEAELADDQLVMLYTTVDNHAPFADVVTGADTLAYISTDIIKRHEGPVAIPKSFNALACQHTMLAGVTASGQCIDCRPELVVAKEALSCLKDLKDVASDIKPGGSPGSALVTPAPRKAPILSSIVGGLGVGATVLTDVVAFKKEYGSDK